MKYIRLILIIVTLLVCSVNGFVYAENFKKLDKDKGEITVKYVVKKEDLLQEKEQSKKWIIHYQREIIGYQERIAEIDALIKILED